MTADANREGFRVLRSEPALFAMELLWRWSFGLGLLALLFFAYAHLRQAILLSDADQSALNGQDPFTFAAAAADLISGAMPLLLKTFTQVFGVAAVLWIAAAALGRGIITRILVRRFAADYGLTIAPDAPRWTSFATLDVRPRADAPDSRHRLSRRIITCRARQRPWTEPPRFRAHHLRLACCLQRALELCQLGAFAGADLCRA